MDDYINCGNSEILNLSTFTISTEFNSNDTYSDQAIVRKNYGGIDNSEYDGSTTTENGTLAMIIVNDKVGIGLSLIHI